MAVPEFFHNEIGLALSETGSIAHHLNMEHTLESYLKLVTL